MDYKVVLNSRNSFSGTNTNNLAYQFDFSNFQDGEYEVSFTYIGEQNDLDATTLGLVFVNLGGSNTFNTGDTNFANTTQQIGHLRPVLTQQGGGASKSYFVAQTIDNHPTFLGARPINQTIEVQIRDAAGALFVDDSSAALGEYVLTLCFRKHHDFKGDTLHHQSTSLRASMY